jgi:hypothetical protein
VSPAALSLRVFGAYVMAMGALLLVAPNAPLTLAGLPPTDEVWIRVLGTVVIVIGWYYIVAGACELRPLYGATAVGRVGIFMAFVVLVLLGMAPKALAAFGAVDFAGAVWTWLTWRTERAGS